MFRKRFLWTPVIVLIVIGLLVVGGFAAHRIGWSRGYMMGQMADVGDSETPVVPRPYGFVRPGRYFGFSPFVFGLGILFMLGLIPLLLVTIRRIFWLRAWKMAGMPMMGECWARHWHRPYGPVPHWWWDRQKSPGGKAEDAEPDEGTGD